MFFSKFIQNVENVKHLTGKLANVNPVDMDFNVVKENVLKVI